MSIFKSKFLVFVLALFCAVPMAFVGCDDKTVSKDPTKEESVSNIFQTIKQGYADFYNYRADMLCTYEYLHVDNSGLGSTVTNKAGTSNVQMHVGENGLYYCIQNDGDENINQAAFLGNALYKYGNTTDMYLPFKVDHDSFVGPLMYYVVHYGLIDFSNFAEKLNQDAITLQTSDSQVVLTIRANLKDFVTQMLDNVFENSDEQLLVVLDEFIKDAFGKNITTRALVQGFFDTYTELTTVESLTTYLNNALDGDFATIVDYIVDLYMVTHGISYSSSLEQTPLSVFFGTDKTNVELCDDVMSKLGEANLTLSNIMDETYTSSNDFVNALFGMFGGIANGLASLYEDLNTPIAKDMVATWTVTMDKQYAFKKMEISLSGNIGVVGANNQNIANTAIDLNIDISFSNVGITEVSFPAVVDNAVLNFDIDLNAIDATATQCEIDLSSQAPFSADLDFYADVYDPAQDTNVSTLVATYDVATRLFIVQTQYLRNAILTTDEVVLTATDAQTGGNYTFNLNLLASAI